MRARRRRGALSLAGFFLVLAPMVARADTMSYKISKNFLRLMYGDGETARVGWADYVNHRGSIDIIGTGDFVRTWHFVAQTEATIVGVKDGGNDCGCHPGFGSCSNSISHAFAHGERAGSLHIAQHSIRDFGWEVDDRVKAGDRLAIEGEVGRTCGNTAAPRAGTCRSDIPEGTTDCQRHFHYNVSWERRDGKRVTSVPMICGSPNLMLIGAYQDYEGGPCDPGGLAPDDYVLSNTTISGWTNYQVYQARESITAVATTVSDSAGVVVRAGDRITLEPGFRVVAGPAHAYFRAEIAPVNTTADRFQRLWNVGDGIYDRARRGRAAPGPDEARLSAANQPIQDDLTDLYVPPLPDDPSLNVCSSLGSEG